MSEKSINVDLDDPRIEKIADVISNKTAKKILGEISDVGKDGLSESEIVEKLKLPANTINYNINKLEESGLIEKSKGFLWSVKGKRIYRYKVSNKKIIISPRTGMKGVIPSFLISGAIALGIKLFVVNNSSRVTDSSVREAVSVEISAESAGAMLAEKSVEVGTKIIGEAGSFGDIAAWFFLGALTGLLIFVLWSWYANSNGMKGGLG